jgi:hypothetical protein
MVRSLGLGGGYLMAAPEFRFLDPDAPSSLSSFLSTAKRVYDLGIALPVLLYACGFVVLGCYSMENNLGLQAFPTIQFFSSGAAFLLLLAVIMAIIAALHALITRYFRWLDQETRFGKWIRKTLVWVVPVCIVVSVVLSKLRWEKLSTAAMILALLAMLFIGGEFVRQLTRFYLYMNGFIAGVALLAWYAFVAYPAIPASFGGGKPQHAYVQVDGKAASDLFRSLVNRRISDSGNLELEADIYLITENSVLMKVPRLSDAAGQNTSTPPSILLQVRRSDVSAVFWATPR